MWIPPSRLPARRNSSDPFPPRRPSQGQKPTTNGDATPEKNTVTGEGARQAKSRPWAPVGGPSGQFTNASRNQHLPATQAKRLAPGSGLVFGTY
jgi:hypothetical protein